MKELRWGVVIPLTAVALTLAGCGSSSSSSASSSSSSSESAVLGGNDFQTGSDHCSPKPCFISDAGLEVDVLGLKFVNANTNGLATDTVGLLISVRVTNHGYEPIVLTGNPSASSSSASSTDTGGVPNSWKLVDLAGKQTATPGEAEGSTVCATFGCWQSSLTLHHGDTTGPLGPLPFAIAADHSGNPFALRFEVNGKAGQVALPAEDFGPLGGGSSPGAGASGPPGAASPPPSPTPATP